MLIISAEIIRHIETSRNTGSAVLVYFYFDFRDEDKKQDVRNAVTSLLIQLSVLSKPCRDIIYRLYSEHGKGTQQPSSGILIDSLKEMLTATQQQPVFIIMDALDECPDLGMPTPREEVLKLVKDLVSMDLPNLHICVTSRPEIDIRTMLQPLAVHSISLHDETGQKMAISNYISAMVSSDRADPRMMRWNDEDKKLVIDELSERADGMWAYFLMLSGKIHPHIVQVPLGFRSTLDSASSPPIPYSSVYRGVTEDLGFG
jgi:hypothetical protein